MGLEQLYLCPRAIRKHRSGFLGQFTDGFSDSLLERGFRPNTIRRHLSNISHFNLWLDRHRDITSYVLCTQDTFHFLNFYSAHAQPRGPLDKHIASLTGSLNRLIHYLCSIGHINEQTMSPLYQPLLDDYLQWLETHQSAAAGTIEVRAGSITRFLQWLGPDATCERCSKLDAERVERFFLDFANTQGYASRRSMQAALRTFFRFCLQQGYIQQSLDLAVPKLRRYKLGAVAQGLNEKQSLTLLGCIDRDRPAGRRDYAICQLLYHYGIRGGQVRALRLDDIDWNGNQILFRALKHGKDTLLPLVHEVGASLLDYLQNARPCCSDPQVFLTLRAPFHALNSSSALSHIIACYIQAAGIEVKTKGSHLFRHGFATRMLAQERSLKSIADVLGHRHLGSTLIYTKVDFEHLKQVALPWPGARS